MSQNPSPGSPDPDESGLWQGVWGTYPQEQKPSRAGGRVQGARLFETGSEGSPYVVRPTLTP